MKILIVDDNKERHSLIFKLVSKYLVPPCLYCFHTYSVADAVAILTNQQVFDIIFLDHDLGETIYQNSDESDTGYQVAKFISAQGIEAKEIIVHSMNYHGSINILSILPQAKYIPIINLESVLQNARSAR